MEQTEEFDLSKPHLKLWAVVDGPNYEVMPNGIDGYFIVVRASGPDSHDEVRDINVHFFDKEEALKVKSEIDNAFEPMIKYLVDDEDEDLDE